MVKFGRVVLETCEPTEYRQTYRQTVMLITILHPPRGDEVVTPLAVIITQSIAAVRCHMFVCSAEGKRTPDFFKLTTNRSAAVSNKSHNGGGRMVCFCSQAN